MDNFPKFGPEICSARVWVCVCVVANGARFQRTQRGRSDWRPTERQMNDGRPRCRVAGSRMSRPVECWR